MIARRGFALAAVLCALVLMAMIVAITAQRALLTARQGMLDAARAEMAAAFATGAADALESPVDSEAYRQQPAGVTLAAGDASAGRAAARWVIEATGTPVVVLDVTAEGKVFRGVARELRRCLLTVARDSAGGLRWAAAEGAGWVRLPSP